MNYRELRFAFTSVEEALNKVEKFLKGGGVGDKGEILLILTKGDLEAIAYLLKEIVGRRSYSYLPTVRRARKEKEENQHKGTEVYDEGI